ncbi:receptor-type tyrosine-protein phosphatase eta-like [Synchiropus picturatus]
MKPPPRFLLPMWTLLVFSAALKVSHAQCGSCSEIDGILMATTTTILSGMPNCSLTVGDISGNGTLTDLSPGTTYMVHLACSGCCQNVTTKPAQVQNLTVTSVTTSSISVSWTEPVGAVSNYKVQWTDGMMEAVANETSKLITELASGTKYNINVSAVADDGLTEGEMATVSQYTRPNQVQDLTVIEVTTSSIRLNWSHPVGGHLLYKVEWNGGNMENTSATSIDISSLSPGVQHQINVTAVAADRRTTGASKNVFQYTRPGKILNATLGSNTTSMWLSWSPPAGQMLNYRLTWHNGGERLIRYSAQESALLSHLTPGGEYTVTLVAIAQDNKTEGESITLSQFTKPAVVRNLSIVEVTTTSVSLSWTPPEGSTSMYIINWSDRANVFSNFTADTSYTIINLTPGSQYNITVTSAVENLSIEGEKTWTTTFTRPEKPLEVTVTPATVSLNISWMLQAGRADHYMLNVSNEDLMYLHSHTTAVTSAIVAGLQPGRLYNVTVVSIADDLLNTSDVYSFATVPTPPGSIIISERTNSSLQIQWGAPSMMADAPSFSYFISYRTSFTESQTTSSTNSTVLSQLSSGTHYMVIVQTVGPQNLKSAGVSQTSFTIPNPVLDLEARPRNTTSITVEWSDPLGVQVFYQYRVRTYSLSGTIESSMEVSDTKAEVHGLEPGTEYRITVETVAAPESVSEPEQTDTYTKPEAVTGLREVHVNASVIQLTWIRQRDHKSSYSYLVVMYLDEDKILNVTTQRETYTFYNLIPGRQYHFDVYTVVGNVASIVKSSSVHTRPEVVSDITVVGGTTDISVMWTPAPGGVDFYVVFLRRDSQLINMTRINHSNGTTFEGLTPGVRYCAEVFTTTSGLNSSSSSVCNATVPTPPGPITVESQTVDSVNVTWTDPGGMDHDQYTFFVSTFNGSYVTKDPWFLMDELEPGTLYNISVVTLGLLDYKSTAVTGSSYTLPHPVLNLEARPRNTTSITVDWSEPQGVQVFYKYRVRTHTSNGTIESSMEVSDTKAEVHGLEPGTEYRITVETMAAPESVSEPEQTDTYTKPEGATGLKEEYVNASVIQLTWIRQRDHKSTYSYLVDMYLDEDKILNVTTQRETYTFYNLIPGRQYRFDVYTVVGGVKSIVANISVLTKPSEVMNITLIGTTTDMFVTWSLPSGHVDSYSVLFKRDTELEYTTSNLSVTSENATLVGLTPGVLYCVVVVTKTAHLETKSSSVCNTTFPTPPGPITVDSQTVSSITFTWMDPDGMSHNQYRFRVTTFRDSFITRNNSVTLDDLQAGTLYSVSVATVGLLAYESTAVTGQNYTIPQRVEPKISSQGSNSSVMVTWNTPPGGVEYYVVTLNGSRMDFEPRRLNNDTQELVFDSLSAGMLYTAVVTTHSGPCSASSEPVSNATFPNRPGPIEIVMKTTGSLTIKWAEPILMDNAEFQYKLEISPPGTMFAWTPHTSYTFLALVSGTPHNITVATVGLMNLKSDPVTIYSVTTRPKTVQSPSLSSEEDKIKVMWSHPDQYKTSYRYFLTWHSFEQSVNRSTTTTKNEFTINHLMPGTSYNISITTETMDGTRGLPYRIDGCTDASPVNDITIQSPNTANAKIVVSWSKPRGHHQGVKLSIPEANIVRYTSACLQNCSLTISNLSHHTEYNLTLETLGCGHPSKPVYISARTGITEPTIPENFESLSMVNDIKYNQFSVQIDSKLLVSHKGPITSVGVLITNSPAGINAADMKKYLGKTYEEWRQKKTSAYLAILRERDLNTRRNMEDMVIVVGDTSKWQSYDNGFLSGNGRYQYAIALFTKVALERGLVDDRSSIVSITDFYPEVHLPYDPEFIGLAVGVPLGIFCMLFIVLIGFIVYWRRLATKESSEIQIHSMGSAAVKVEDFEAFYKKQKADSNCGFAEEFEDLKVVGTGQAKLNALSVENKPKNRYNNVLPYDSSRVKLSIISGSPYDDYINANYMPGYLSRKEFIAAQGPLPGTVNEFWRMIWEKNVQTVVMLTRCIEQGKIKCEQYWTEDTKHYANITVTKTSEVPLDDWTIREFDIKNVKTAETRTIRHFHFTAWPDHGVPETTELLISFRHLVREHMDQYSKFSPTVVHCSAGVGRTGTFIAIDRLVFQIERENVVDIYGVVHDLRLHRPLMVQTEAQYVFLNQCALDIIKSRTGTNVDLIYQNTAAFSLYENLELKRFK